jgi:S-adenosylmethionine:tRNA ribosyltransferase-isomerase
MKLSSFDYHLPENLIAQTPAEPRDHSRLLVYERKTGEIAHQHFFDLPKYLEPGDLLVFNDSKVLPLRIIGKKTTGGRMEFLLLKNLNDFEWETIVGGGKQKAGLKIFFAAGLEATLIERLTEKSWQVRFNFSKSKLLKLLDKIGQVPTPPYIKSSLNTSELKKKYQTVYAKYAGSAAAPTAGFHFTRELIEKIKEQGINTAFVTLHVGLGTFAPVSVEKIEDHEMHHEWGEVKKTVIKKILQTKKLGGRVIAVGTTSARILETLFSARKIDPQKDFQKETNIFIYPGYKFKIVDALITNFHLPKSTLLMLVAALIGREEALKLYKLAIRAGYRFFSFGDAMFIKR